MKILLLTQNQSEAQSLQADVEGLGHQVRRSADPEVAANWLSEWEPDLFVTEDKLGRNHPDAGLQLAELCRANNEAIPNHSRTEVLMLAHLADWNCMKRARQTGAHVIVKGPTLDAVVRYVQTVADALMTDRMLGPILFAMHRFHGESSVACNNCEWVGASVAYGRSQADLQLTIVRTALLNALLFVRRGQSATEIVQLIYRNAFLMHLLKSHELRETAIKMEIARLRQDIENALVQIGAPYHANVFLPAVQHGYEKYRLAGSWHLSHISADTHARTDIQYLSFCNGEGGRG